MVVLWSEKRCGFRGTPGRARGWTLWLQDALFFPTADAAAAHAKELGEHLVPLHVCLSTEPIDELLPPELVQVLGSALLPAGSPARGA